MSDGVNVAAVWKRCHIRVGICILEAVYGQASAIGSRLELVDLGEHRVKNIARPIHAYSVPLPSEEGSRRPFEVSTPSSSKTLTSSSAEPGRLPTAWNAWSSKLPMARHSCSSMA